MESHRNHCFSSTQFEGGATLGDIVLDILACVPRCDYTTLSVASKQFRSLVKSPIYARRSLLDCTEHCLYAILYNLETRDNEWYILRREANGSGHGLALIPSLRNVPCDGSFVAAGSRIYVFGWREDDDNDTTGLSSSALSIDCRSHTVQPLPSMHVAMTNTVAGVIDGKVYVIEECLVGSKLVVMVVFNTETQTWELGMTKQRGSIRCLVVW